jgi:hypothetical protein
MKFERGALNSDQCILRKRTSWEKIKYVDRRIIAKCASMGCDDVDSVDLIPL